MTDIDLVIFCCPKPFIKEFATVQQNAILSWTQLPIKTKIVVVGKEQGIAEFCQEHKLVHEPNIKYNEYNTPLLDSIFEVGHSHAVPGKPICYINCDIMLMSDFAKTVLAATKLTYRYLIVGQRFDWNHPCPIKFTPKWEEYARNLILKDGKLHQLCGIDYFLYSDVSVIGKMPPFAIGKCAWDNYLVYVASQNKATVINASKTVLAVHCESPWLSNNKVVSPGHKRTTPDVTVQVKANRAMMGKRRHTIKHSKIITYYDADRNILFKKR
jgi:hypothetical protein